MKEYITLTTFLIVFLVASLVTFIGVSTYWRSRTQETQTLLNEELARPERCVMVVEPPESLFILIPKTGMSRPPDDFVITYLCGKDLLYHFPNPTGEVANPFDSGDFN